MTPLAPPSKAVELNGLRINYLDWGAAGAPPIVCVHGYTSSAQAFNAPARHFQDRFRLDRPRRARSRRERVVTRPAPTSTRIRSAIWRRSWTRWRWDDSP